MATAEIRNRLVTAHNEKVVFMGLSFSFGALSADNIYRAIRKPFVASVSGTANRKDESLFMKKPHGRRNRHTAFIYFC